MVQGTELLTLCTFLHKLRAVSLESRLVITDPEEFGSHRSCIRVVATCPLVDFFENILGLVLGDAFQQRP